MNNRPIFLQARPLSTVFMIGFVLLFTSLAGCSGGSKGTSAASPLVATSGLGRYKIIVKWPTGRAAVLEQAQSIVFSIQPASGPAQTQTLSQSDANDFVEFDSVPVGDATVTGKAFTGEDGTGTLIGEGTSVVTIVADQTSEKDLVFVAVDTPSTGSTGGIIIRPVDSPVVEPPVVDPPVVEPPVVDPPVVEPTAPKQTLLRVSFLPPPVDGRYQRGAHITLKVEQYSPDKVRAAGQNVTFVQDWQVESTHQRKSSTLGARVTDDTGTALLAYTVPVDAQVDDIKIEVSTPGSADWQPHKVSSDLPVGTAIR